MRTSRKLKVNKTEVIKRSLESYLAQIEPGRTPYELGADLFGEELIDSAPPPSPQWTPWMPWASAKSRTDFAM